MEGQNEKIKILKTITGMSLKREDIHVLEGTSPDIEFLLMESLELEKSKRFGECVETLQAVLDVTWEELNTGHWSLVPDCQRVIYSAASLLKVVALVQQAIQSPVDTSTYFLDKAVKSADMGLLLGSSCRDELTQAAHLLSQAISLCSMHHWPSLRLWGDLDYLLAVAGSRTVPVELGSSYAQADWSQRLMTLREFVTRCISGEGHSTDGIGYLAQHQLFDQVPELKKDIVVPDYCACSDVDGERDADVDINAWFGPAGTVSPLHHDPKHNLLCQVVGRKRVVLYPPSDSDCLYPHEGRLLSNTARVDPEAPDYNLYPKYRNTLAHVCLLLPGEMLYIPPTWWHHVRALDLSFSVSFWWT